ncbi:hypothetical protein BT96DRAFT_33814 [Gymnopus androsaceus JB14]|uniref:Uncharacterized protein n=1 Tax=Gymnopus androsaceus JB14 TaxID=1447944 RepID=A0A6A4GDV5_9AGAR|nr:hypothetical protein BT96DRAFT_33814 [Gymnopus androsaceus JB14]
MVWDILTHLSDDIELLFLPRSFRLPTIAYFISRYTFLAYFILLVAEDVKGQCTAPKAMALTGVGYIAVVTTLLQFLVRAKAIFSDNRFAQWFFNCLWLAAVGGTLLVVTGASSGICNSDYSYYIPVISILVHDSCVFAAISYRIYRMALTSPRSMRSRSDLPSTVQVRFKMTILTLWGRTCPH